MARQISKARAARLWQQVREGLVNAEAALIEIISTGGWRLQGYSTFTEAWNAELSEVRLATDAMRAHVVFGLLAEGLSDEQIIEAVAGRVSDETVGRLRYLHGRGVPADAAYSRVRAHDRAKPGERKYLHIELTDSEIRDFKAIAERRGLDVEQESAKAIRAHFRRLERARA